MKYANAMLGYPPGGGMGGPGGGGMGGPGGGMGGPGGPGGMGGPGGGMNPMAMAPPPPGPPQSGIPGGGMGALPPPPSPAGVGMPPGGGGGSMGGPKAAAYRLGQRMAIQQLEKQAEPDSALHTSLAHGALSSIPGALLGGALGAYKAGPGGRGSGALKGALTGGLVTGGVGGYASGKWQNKFRSGVKGWEQTTDESREKILNKLKEEGIPLTEDQLSHIFNQKNWYHASKGLGNSLKEQTLSKQAMGERMNRFGKAVGDMFGSGMGAAASTATRISKDDVAQNVDNLLKGVREGVSPHIRDAGNFVSQGAKALKDPLLNAAKNPYVQGGAGALAALYGGKKLYDAHQERKLRGLAGDLYSHQYPGFEGAQDLGRMMAKRRLGEFRT